MIQYGIFKLFEETQGGLPWWAWVLIVLIALLLLALLIWLFTRGKEEAEASPEPRLEEAHMHEAEAAPLEAPAAAAPVEPEVEMPAAAPRAAGLPDDLKIIEGIGPKIASVLQAAGIGTFAELAATSPERISEILLAAGLRLADPGTWPEQARLAAEGKLDELQALQDSLKGGRKV